MAALATEFTPGFHGSAAVGTIPGFRCSLFRCRLRRNSLGDQNDFVQQVTERLIILIYIREFQDNGPGVRFHQLGIFVIKQGWQRCQRHPQALGAVQHPVPGNQEPLFPFPPQERMGRITNQDNLAGIGTTCTAIGLHSVFQRAGQVFSLIVERGIDGSRDFCHQAGHPIRQWYFCLASIPLFPDGFRLLGILTGLLIPVPGCRIVVGFQLRICA